MALTREIITANAVLSGLSDEQINALVTLSENDENTVTGQRIGEIYRTMDATIATATGVQRNGDEKTYNYLERAAKSLNEKAQAVDGLNRQIADLTKEKNRLEKAMADGSGDAETKRQLEQSRKDLAAVTKQYNDLKTEFETATANHANEVFGIRVENELSVATSGIKFKAELPKSVTDVLLQQTIGKIKGMNPEYIDNGNGGKQLVFKDENGAIMRNPENQLNPFTTAELVTRELKTLGVLDEARKQTGGGTNGGNGGNGGSQTVDISGAKTRVEAHEIATQQLLAQGLTIGSDAFDSEMKKIWADNNISALPEK